MEDDPPILNITAGLATLKRCDTVLAKGSEFNQKGEADIGRRRLVHVEQNSFRRGLAGKCLGCCRLCPFVPYFPPGPPHKQTSKQASKQASKQTNTGSHSDAKEIWELVLFGRL